MANGGNWDPTNLPKRPGLYINFVNAALDAIQGGDRGTVGIPIFTYSGTAVASEFYEITETSEADALVGEANSAPIKLVLQGGANKALVYAVPAVVSPGTVATQYAALREAFEQQDFNVFVYPDTAPNGENVLTKTWVAGCRSEGKHFSFIAGGSSAEDADFATGNTRSAAVKDEYVINLITGGVLPDGTSTYSAKYAPLVAGLVAGTPINQSITYAEVPLTDVSPRLKNSQIETSLEAGSLLFVRDGDVTLIEQGITTNLGKIRTMRAKQAIATDIPRTARRSYIGKVNNDSNGQASLIAAIKSYLETLQNEGVLAEPIVELDPLYPSTGDKVFLAVSYLEVDSMERIFMTITTRQ